VAYIKKFSADTYLQTNLFYLLNNDQIHNSVSNPEYRNVVDTDIYGFELEYKGNISSVDELYLNYSYVDGKSYTQDEGRSESIPNVAHHLAKGYYVYNLNSDLSLSGVVKYVGSKDRVFGDTREKVKAYSSVDSSLYYKDPRYNYCVTLSIKNMFNTSITYPSPPNTYIEDYAQEGRTFLVTLKKEF
ncbi:MAG: outer rane receptor for ferrienterochelin and colicin, partial [Campylobacterota bacterium]|nr:outer rane receptor for ferrienterochelin and colicin [Campylobacterota bacterium]